MRYPPALFLLLSMITAMALAAEPGPALIPLPQKMECREGAFQLQPKTGIVVDGASKETGRYLAERLRSATGFQAGGEIRRPVERGRGCDCAHHRGRQRFAGARGLRIDGCAGLGGDSRLRPGGHVLRRSDVAAIAAAGGVFGQADAGRGMEDPLRANPGPAAVQMARVHVRCVPPFLHQGRGEGVAGRAGVAEDQHAPPAPDG